MQLKIVVYSKSACPQCESAKMLLKTRSLDFEEIKIDGEAERMAFYRFCQWRFYRQWAALRRHAAGGACTR